MWRPQVAGKSRTVHSWLEQLERRELLAFVPELVSTQNFFPDDFYPIATEVIGGTLFFVADDGITGLELWKSDGTAQGTVLVKDIKPGRETTGYGPQSLTEVNGLLLFAADDGAHGWELWRSDGTQQGTAMVKDIRTGPQDSIDDTGFNVFASAGGNVYFAAFDGIHGRELWRSDGTEAGTMMVTDPATTLVAPEHLIGVGDLLYFNSDGLWVTDGTRAGTARAGDIPFHWYPRFANGSSLFLSGRQLEKAEGARVTVVKDIWPNGDAYPNRFTSWKGEVYFVANDGVHGVELWKTDGTAAGTRMVHDSIPGPGSGGGTGPGVGDIMYFMFDDGVHGQELWGTNGDANGSRMIKDINTGIRRSYPRHMTGVNDTLFFSAYHPDSGFELWQSDGTEAGTLLVQDIRPGYNYYRQPLSADPESLTVFNGSLYFFAHDDARYRALYRLVEIPDRQPGDTDGDGDVDVDDLNNVRSNFGATGNVLGDANGDGSVDILDLNAVRNSFGAGVPSPAPVVGDGRQGNEAGPRVAALIEREAAATRSSVNWQDALFRAQAEAWVANDANQPWQQARRLKAVDRWFAML